MSLILQTEAALADAVAAEAAAAAEFAEANSLFLESIARREAAASTVKRIRSALSALSGESTVGTAQVDGQAAPAPAVPPFESPCVTAVVPTKQRKQKSGLQCPSCGDVGTLNQYAGYKGSTKTVTVCSGCSAEFVS